MGREGPKGSSLFFGGGEDSRFQIQKSMIVLDRRRIYKNKEFGHSVPQCYYSKNLTWKRRGALLRK